MAATLTFDDEFNALNLWSGARGVWSTTPAYVDPAGSGSTLASNGEQEWYINANYAPTASVKPWTVGDGVLTISAQKADAAISQAIGGYAYTSGMIETDHSFSQTYGYFEMRAELPAGDGLWPAFWLMPKDGSWPPELDIMEVLGKDPSTLYTTVHTLETGSHTSSSSATSGTDLSSGYHTYAVDWEADQIRWYLDGKEVYHVATPADLNKPMYMIANLAVGGYWPGHANASTPLPAEMKIDYIKAWSSDPYTDGSSQTVAAPQANTITAASDAGQIIDGSVRNDRIFGGAGADQIQGLEGADTINGKVGDDTVSGGLGNDWLYGGQGNDVISSGGGHDLVFGNLGNDTIDATASEGGSVVRGGRGDDFISGGSADDWLSGDRGADTLTGGAGADTFHFFNGAQVDLVTDFSASAGDRVQLDPDVTYTVSQSGADVHVDTSRGDELVLQHTQLSSLGAGWIVSV